MKALVFVLLIFSTAVAQPTRTRVISCALGEGSISLEQTSDGRFLYAASEGFGDGNKGEVTLTLMKAEKNKPPTCRLIARSSSAPKFQDEFSWPLGKAEVTEAFVKSHPGVTCEVSKRFAQPLASCDSVPKAETLGCAGESGVYMVAQAPDGQGEKSDTQIIVFAGGMTIDTARKSYSGARGFSVWKSPKSGGWCYGEKSLFPFSCKPLKEAVAVKDVNGTVIGTVAPEGDDIIVHYKSSSTAGFAKLAVNSDGTSLTGYLGQGQESGRLTVKGNIHLPEAFRGYAQADRADLLAGDRWISTCKGIEKFAGASAAPTRRNEIQR